MMPRDMTVHPEPEDLAAFAEGKLDARGIASLGAHLRECEDCRMIVGESVRFLREDAAAQTTSPVAQPARRAPWLIAAAVAAIAAGVLWTTQRATRDDGNPASPVATLVAAAPRDVRFIEARLTGGFPYAPIADVKRGAPERDPRQMELTGAAGRVLRETAGDTSNRGRHAAAVAQLLSGDAASAVSILEAEAKKSNDAGLWTDLAAAQYEVAIRSGASERLEAALSASDQALRIKPALPEALFNRAVVLEQLNLKDAAVDAWKRYLQIDANSGWSEEARGRLQRLQAPRADFESTLERHYAALQRGERTAAASVVAIDAGDARYFVETEVFARWGEAYLRGDVAAEQHLNAARALATSLNDLNGDALLVDAVAAIERARPSTKRDLAAAHVELRDGRAVFRRRKPTEAEKMLAHSASAFEFAGSPLLHQARLYETFAIFEQNRRDEAHSIFRRLEKTVPARYRTSTAYVQWGLASGLMARGDWGGAITALDRALAILEQQKENANVAYVHDILSQAYDTIGDRSRAWQHRVNALRETGKKPTYRLQHAIFGMGRQAARRRDWRAAISYLALEVDVAGDVGDKQLHVDALLRRALLHSRFGNAAAASADVREAAALTSAITDPALLARTRAEQMAATALVSSRPDEAIQLLTDAIRFHEQGGWRSLIPELYLRRGRMHKVKGDRAQSLADFETGIAEVEAHRQGLPQGETRWGMLDSANELFEEAIESALVDGAEKAFAYAERQRARSLTDVRGARSTPDYRSVPEGSLLVEYAALPRNLVVFTVDRQGYRASHVDITRDDLAALVRRCTEEMSRADRLVASPTLHTVYDTLIAPVRAALDGRTNLLIVPDAVTAAVPFAALLDRSSKRALIEDHSISVAPSARMFASSRKHRRPETVLVVDNPSSESMAPLAFAARESDAIVSEYPRAQRLSGRAATASVFLEQAPRFDVVHFAGHGLSSGDGAALILAGSENESGSINVARLARLQLTRTSLVVLAACGSARGPAYSSEGVLSVAYAFLHAGAPVVIATLWPISDADAAEFFPRLHRRLAQGTPPAEALQKTQIECIQGAKCGRPSLWAAVQVIGS